MDKISKDKQYTTREGFPYRCYATDGDGDYPVHGAFFLENSWRVIRHTEYGRAFTSGEDKYDLVEVKPRMKFERWVVLHRNGERVWWMTRPSDTSTVNAFAIKHIVFEVEEGEGLDAV
jgi:hypothetical protein